MRRRPCARTSGAQQHDAPPRGSGVATILGAGSGRSTTGLEGAVGDVGGGAIPADPATSERSPEEPDPCPPDVLCTPSGRLNEGSSDGAGGAKGRASNDGEKSGERSSQSAERRSRPPPDLASLSIGSERANGSPQGNQPDGGSSEGEGGNASGDSPEKAPDVKLAADRDTSQNDQGGGVNGFGGTNDATAESSELAALELAEEHVEGLWQSSAEGTVEAIEDGLAGERTSVPWRDLHAWYEAIAEDAVAKESVPVTRRAYVQHYFDAIAPLGEAP